MKSRKQRTIKYPVSCTGVGLHTGVQSTITFNPAPEGFGIKFSRTDKKDVLVTPDIDNVVDLTRGTTIQEKGVKVHTTEHVLSACAGMGVDNLLIELNSKDGISHSPEEYSTFEQVHNGYKILFQSILALDKINNLN